MCRVGIRLVVGTSLARHTRVNLGVRLLSMLSSIISRALAVLILALPTGYIVHDMDTRDWQLMQTYSHSELLVHLEAVRLPSRTATIFLAVMVGLGFTACVEVLAWLLRRATFNQSARIVEKQPS